MPHAWDSKSGNLDTNAKDGVENENYFGADSIVELQVIPETAPEGPEGITVTGVYKGLKISWKAHQKAKDYDLYYRKVGEGAWIKANDPNDPKYQDSDTTNDVPDGAYDLTPEQKQDSDELIRGTSYEINGLEDQATYEIKMTATNHHGTGGLSKTYLGKTTALVPPKLTNYKLINNVEDGKVKQVPVGTGQFNYHLLLKILKERKPHIDIILEGTSPKDLAGSVKFIEEMYERI